MAAVRVCGAGAALGELKADGVRTGVQSLSCSSSGSAAGGCTVLLAATAAGVRPAGVSGGGCEAAPAASRAAGCSS